MSGTAMGDRHDYVALEWVKGEIAETLKQARQALEAYVESPQDPTRMGFCLAYIHQVRGTLQMVEFYGAALLAEEMEHLTQALIDDSVASQREALEVLMQAILQLPVYLDRIQTARRDLPMVVLPLLNDLRAARGEKLLSETSLFSPDLSQRQVALPVDALARLRTAELPVLLRKLRQMLQVAIVGVLRNHDLPTNLGYMARVFARLESLCKDAPLEQLWAIASGIVEGLANGSIQNGTSMRTLLRQIDHELKRLIEEGADGMNQPAPDELVKNLLFYVAKASDQSPRVRALKDAYRLDDALPGEAVVDEERARLAGPDRDAMRSVVGALCEELVRVKDSLDLFVRSDRSAVAELRPLLVPLKQIADTLAVLGFGQPRKVVLDQIDVVGDLVDGQREPSDGILMDVAGALLYVEATLAGMAGPGEERGDEENRLPTTDVGQIHQVVIKEARNGLELAKDSIIEFIASQWNHEHLAKVPELLTQVRGGLSMIEQPRAATLLEACNRYIQEQLLARKAVPDWNSLDTLADAITGVEYYLERLSDDQGTQSDLILDVAEESLESLGYALRPPQVEPEVAPNTSVKAALMADGAALAAELQLLSDELDADTAETSESSAGELSAVAEAYADVPAWDLAPEDDHAAALLLADESLQSESDTLSVGEQEVAPELAWDLAPSMDESPASPAESASVAADEWLLPAGKAAEAQTTELAWELPSAPIETATPGTETPLLLDEAISADLQPEPLMQSDAGDLSADPAETVALAGGVGADTERSSLPADKPLPELAWELSPEPVKEPSLLASDDNWSLTELPATEPLDEGVDLSLDAPLEVSHGELAGFPPAADEGSLDSLSLEPEPVAPLVLDDPLSLDSELPLLESLALDTTGSERPDDISVVEDGWLLGETLPARTPAAESSEIALTEDPQWEFEAAAPAATEPLTLADSEWLLDTPLSPASEPLDLSELSLESLEVEPVPELAGDQPVELRWELEVLPPVETVDGAPAAAGELPLLDSLEDWPETPLPSLDEAGASTWNGLDIDSLDLPEVELPQAAAEPEVPAIEPASPALTLAEVLAAPTQAINPPAREVPPSLLPPPADEEPVDEELREVFIEEAAEVLESIGEYLPCWQAATDNREALTEIRRAFHTLKGSGRMVRALVIGELAWSIENLLNRVLDRSIPADAAVLDVVTRVTALMPELVQEYAANAQRQRDDVDYLAAIAHALAKGQPVPPPSGGERAPGETAATDESESAAVAQAPEDDEGLDPQLLDIFRNEAEAHLETLVGFLADCARELPKPVTDDLQRALHTLKGSAHMAGILPIAEVATPLERLVKEFKTNQLQVDLREAELLHEAEQLFRVGLDQLVAGHPLAPIAGSDVLLARIAQVHQERLDAAEAQRRGETGEAGSDPQMLGVFLSEGMDILLDAEDLLKRWREHPEERQELGALRAELETLGRGAHLADLPQMGELCDALLTVYDAVQQGELAVNEAFFVAAEQAHECLIGMMDQVAAALEVSACPEQVAALQRLLLAATSAEPLLDLDSLGVEDFPLEDDELLDTRVTAPADLPEELIVQADAAPALAPEPQVGIEAQSEPQSVVAAAPARLLDDEMVEIFLEEAVDILESAGQALDQWRSTPEVLSPLSTLQRDLHTLKGGARMADIREIGDLSHELESLYEGLLDRRFQGTPALLDLLQACHDCLAGHLDQLQAHQALTDPQALIRAIRDFRQNPKTEPSSVSPPLEEAPQALSAVELDNDVAESEPEPAAEPPAAETAAPALVLEEQHYADDELVDIFLEEGFDILDSAAAALRRWMGDVDNSVELEALQRDVHTLKGGARMAEIRPIGDLTHELEFLYEGLSGGRLRASSGLFDLLLRCHDRLADMLDAVQARRAVPTAGDLIEAIQAFRNSPEERLNVPASVSVQPLAPATSSLTSVDDDVSAEILDIFLEEADDLLESLEQALGRWDAEQDNGALDEMLRVLHTLKGGARLAEQNTLGDLAHDLEEHLTDAQRQGASWPDSLLLDVQSGLDALQEEVQVLRERLDAADEQVQVPEVQSEMPPVLVAEAEPEWLPEPPSELPQVPLEASESAALVSLPHAIMAAQDAPRQVQAKILPFVKRAQEAAQEHANRRAPQELVKVPAPLLEGLVNLAGETSIFRGRVEQQVSDVGATLGEMDATIERVRDQLRRLDTETQAQILSRHHADTDRAGYEDFDPLEMDRYSQLQQLSRALFESASDLFDLKETLAAKNRDAETLLLQQARVNTELQEGLMRTRMVPFDRLVPRLRRIVRQVAGELGKQVEFIVGNAEGEMDRAVLERIVAPLEHMLRNAVDHGIESAEARRSAGKSETGTIRLTLGREGGDVLLTLADDGGGIRLDAVRRKAVERGLMNSDSDLSDHEVLQFILEAGFTTAEKLTQISGRGVGLDVVNSEVKQLGGSMSIHSDAGQGTRFIVRLPFTVSVNRALMVLSGEDLYAVPLNTIEGIVRVSPYELEALYEGAAEGQVPRFEYAGQSYELKYLGDLLNNGQHPKLVGQSLPLPVILVRSTEHAVAIQVDALAGSREIVVKSLGAQFAAVSGISGATILGDGRVVVILDLLATIRSRLASAALQAQPRRLLPSSPSSDSEYQRPTLVMVVDDSVTVRKVTSRLLERNGMNVLTAKDGVDAIAQLQEQRPDIMLLDIEMPRMDGFEVATLVRHDERLKNLPIIMITSRTGEKHRERALSIGVNEYLGKPYQESELLQSIQQWVKRHV